MKRLFIITLALCGLTLFGTSCKEKRLKDFQQTEDGLYYKFITENPEARKAEIGDYLFLSISCHTYNDSLAFMNTAEQDAIDKMMESIYPADPYSAYGLMHEGDEAVFAFKADSFLLYFFRYPEIPDYIQDTTMIFFTIKINKIRNEEEMIAEKNEEIKQYMVSHNLTAEPTESGLYYIEKQAGKGKELMEGDSISINYIFRFTNDSLFDSSEGRDPLYCIVGQMFPGLNEGLGKMKRGGKATLIMPYSIAFGAISQYVPVPPFTTIVADIEVLPTIVHPKPAPAPTPVIE